MARSTCVALAVVFLVSSTVLAFDDKDKKDTAGSKKGSVVISKVDPSKGEIVVKRTDDKGNSREETLKLTEEVRLMDETGRVANLAVFQSGDEVLLVESNGKVQEVRRASNRDHRMQVRDTVQTLIERAANNPDCAADLQAIYDQIRKLDTAKNGKIDHTALEAEADQVLQQRVKEAFSRLDTKKSGRISKEEARGLIREHFDKIDTNKDGFIDFEELLKAAKNRNSQSDANGQSTSRKQQ